MINKDLCMTAKLTQLLPIQTVTGKNGESKKQNIIVETEDQYPRKICVSIWGDKINEGHLQIGNKLKIDFDIESRDYNGRWYTDIKAWKIELATSRGQTNSNVPDSKDGPKNEEDDLPFKKKFYCAESLHNYMGHLHRN